MYYFGVLGLEIDYCEVGIDFSVHLQVDDAITDPDRVQKMFENTFGGRVWAVLNVIEGLQ